MIRPVGLLAVGVVVSGSLLGCNAAQNANEAAVSDLERRVEELTARMNNADDDGIPKAERAQALGIATAECDLLAKDLDAVNGDRLTPPQQTRLKSAVTRVKALKERLKATEKALAEPDAAGDPPAPAPAPHPAPDKK